MKNTNTSDFKTNNYLHLCVGTTKSRGSISTDSIPLSFSRETSFEHTDSPLSSTVYSISSTPIISNTNLSIALNFDSGVPFRLVDIAVSSFAWNIRNLGYCINSNLYTVIIEKTNKFSKQY